MTTKEKIQKYTDNFCWALGIIINVIYGSLFLFVEIFALVGMFESYYEEDYLLLLVYIVVSLFAISFRIWNEKKLY